MNWRTDLHSGPAVSTDKVSLLTLEHLRLSSEPLETNLQITISGLWSHHQIR